MNRGRKDISIRSRIEYVNWQVEKFKNFNFKEIYKHAGNGIVQRLENMNRPGREFSLLREQLRAHASFSVNDVVMLQIFTKFVRNPPNGCFVSSKNIRNIFNYTEYVRFIVFLTRGLAQKSRIWRESL